VVITAGKEFVRRHGKEALSQVAKLHFRTTASVLNKSPGNQENR
jgi:ribonuclease HIII